MSAFTGPARNGVYPIAGTEYAGTLRADECNYRRRCVVRQGVPEARIPPARFIVVIAKERPDGTSLLRTMLLCPGCAERFAKSHALSMPPLPEAVRLPESTP